MVVPYKLKDIYGIEAKHAHKFDIFSRMIRDRENNDDRNSECIVKWYGIVPSPHKGVDPIAVDLFEQSINGLVDVLYDCETLILAVKYGQDDKEEVGKDGSTV